MVCHKSWKVYNFFYYYFKIFKALGLWADAFYKLKCPSVCPSVRVFTFEVPLKHYFAPTSQSRMSNIFRDSESLGKSSGNKLSQIWKFLLQNGLKLPRGKCFLQFFFFICSLLRYCLNVFLPPLLVVGCPKLLEIRIAWGKGLERSGLRFEHLCSKMI